MLSTGIYIKKKITSTFVEITCTKRFAQSNLQSSIQATLNSISAFWVCCYI